MMIGIIICLNPIYMLLLTDFHVNITIMKILIFNLFFFEVETILFSKGNTNSSIRGGGGGGGFKKMGGFFLAPGPACP